MQSQVAKIRGRTFRFWTQAGVFSKERVDNGSKLLLENIEINKRARILDLGCGCGVMGIVAGALFDSKVTLVDSDIRAVRLTKKNLEENNIENGEAKISDGFSDLGEEKFDVILSYPPSHEGKEVVEGFIKEGVKHLNKNGKYYLVTEKRLKDYYKRLMEASFKNSMLVKTNDKHVLFLGEN